MRFFGLGEFSLCPETHFKGIFKFKGRLMAVCGLDHSGSLQILNRSILEWLKVLTGI